ncbi:hypothetical protein Tco_1062656, partial [Tanacetum coccineum]
WEKYDAKGWCEKGAHKYGRLNEQPWWEKWGDNYERTCSKMVSFQPLKLICVLSKLDNL